MVGVAGKSKGCATCRRRKIKCDETRPICQRCQNSNLTCGGYARYAVFIDRGITGYRKRAPLEEIQPCTEISMTFSPEAESVRLIAWFCDAHKRSLPSPHAFQSKHHWLELVGPSPTQHPALRTSFLAVAFVKWSMIERDRRLRQHGMIQYSHALGHMQRALSSNDDVLSDDILVTICVMVLYELAECTTENVDAWLRHMSGAANLISLRGPRAFSEPATRAVFEQMRYIFLIHHLLNRTSSVFGQPEWLELPWEGVEKAVEQQVFDQGLRVTTLLDRSDLIARSLSLQQDTEMLLNLCVDICEQVDRIRLQLNWCTLKMNSDSTTSSIVDPEALLLSITALGIQLGAAISAQDILYAFEHGQDRLESFPSVNPATMTQATRLRDGRKELASQILELTRIRTKTPARSLGIIRMKWACEMAVQQLQSTNSDYELGESILESLSGSRSPFDALKTTSR